MAANSVELGFVEEVANPVRLTSPFFSSKVGGKPAWLARSGLPDSTLLLCKCCEKPLIFLLQIYVPSDSDEDPAFHRAIFVFCCRNGTCYEANSKTCFAAFRCQLPRENEFYVFEPLDDIDEHFSEFQERESKMKGTWSPLCEVCGCSGEKQCGKCHLVRYCSKEHQVIDWKGGHKLVCCKETQGPRGKSSSEQSTHSLFPEYELVTEPEQIVEDKSENKDDVNMREYKKYIKENADVESQTVSDKEWELLAAESKGINNIVEDKKYWEFKKRISNDPDQVLRYQRNGKPLWVSKVNIPEESDVPKCSCGADRTFEFQILPQLLNHLKVDSFQASVDWGTVVVYTCSKNCSAPTSYSEEFVWKQDFSKTGLPADVLAKLKK